ncbi:MAG TPA: hypothetical protein DD979_11435 [Gammaproteobacteria bacterium]|jgi:carbon monoxide dehydrogenase subunit G|nr:hypothetical protein [Gammaproteobacteria bacterium]
MKINTSIHINASRDQVWQHITDIDRAADMLSAVEEIEVLERPEAGLVGLKWRETRTLFGKTATEVMWITHASAPDFYDTRAESHGMIYRSSLRLREEGEGTRLRMGIAGEAQSWGTRIMAVLMGMLFKRATYKAIKRDLADIKAAVESDLSPLRKS